VLDGILLLDKPLGLSSNAVLQKVRRALGGVKAGHTGSLDPLASGMLPVCIGEATKVAGELLAGDKCYRFSIRLGESRTTGDAEGAVTLNLPVPELPAATLTAAVESLRGEQWQEPPMYSALKHQGRRLYQLAREGITVERAPRRIVIRQLDLLTQGDAALELRCRCSGGTYIRTLSEELARRLGTCGYVSSLRREWVAPFEGEPMIRLEDLVPGVTPPLLSADRALPHLPAVHLDAAGTLALQQGRTVAEDATPDSAGDVAPGLVRLYDADGRFFGLGVRQTGRVLPKRLYSTAAGTGSP
jgi:tRNA pseudouridine55 synthase